MKKHTISTPFKFYFLGSDSRENDYYLRCVDTSGDFFFIGDVLVVGDDGGFAGVSDFNTVYRDFFNNNISHPFTDCELQTIREKMDELYELKAEWLNIHSNPMQYARLDMLIMTTWLKLMTMLS